MRLTAIALILSATMAAAQGANVNIGAGAFDPDQPVEVTADELSVDQATGKAVFAGNVLVIQGEVRMSAGQVTVEYATDDSGSANGISRLLANGGVTFVTATDAAESQTATYTIESGQVVMSGDVLLTQGPNALSGQQLVIDLTSGAGRMEGRVRTVLGGGNN